VADVVEATAVEAADCPPMRVHASSDADTDRLRRFTLHPPDLLLVLLLFEEKIV